MALRTISVFSGVGWLDVGFQAGLASLGIANRTVCYVERDSYAAACLVARMEDSALDSAPVWDDIATFDGRPWRGRVDFLIGGPPCQPYSLAGKRSGHDDDRSHGTDGSGPLEHLVRVIGEIHPSIVLLENVPAWVRGGWFRRFGEAVSRMGFRWQTPLFVSAADVGAPHKRERVFLLAESEKRRFGKLWESSDGDGLVDGCCSAMGSAMGNTERIGRWGQMPWRATQQRVAVTWPGSAVGHTGGARPQERRSERGDACEERQAAERAGGCIFPPGPGDFDGWKRVVADDDGDFRAPAIKPGFRVLADGRSLVVDASRADQLRCAGNGVVALQAAVASAVLVGGLMERSCDTKSLTRN